jgi:serine/threonine-protein kinase
MKPGTRFDEAYELGPLLGAGGMGEVYKAKDVRLGRPVAIKVLRADATATPERLARFEQEARTASALNHPNVITIYDIGKVDDTSYIVMEYVEGKTLRDLLEDGPLPMPRLLDYASQMAEALAKAHAGGIVHRDLKPENLMVTADGLVKILDFGLAKLTPNVTELSTGATGALTASGVLMGTVHYMSPEQTKTSGVDHRSDQFTLGMILYEMATGRRAFQRDSVGGTLMAIMAEQPTPVADLNPSVPEGLVQVIGTCLQKEPEQRFVSTTELARELRALHGDVSSMDTAVAPPGLRAAPAAAAPQQPSVAVLPFADMSPAKDQEYFCDGMAEELINALTQIPGMRVVSRTSSFQFKGKVDDVRSIGQRLGVRSLLEGSVRTAGERMRIGSRLTNVSDGYQMWSAQYDRDMKDVFAVQDEIAAAILAALRVTLIKGDDKPIVRRQASPEAYKLYLKGRHEWNKRTEEGLMKSIEFFSRAIDEEPTYARAHAGLADAYVLLGIYGIRPPNDVMPKAKATAARALEEAADLSVQGEVDTGLAAVYTTLACVTAAYDWEWEESEQTFQQAIRHDPKYPIAHHWYAVNCLAPQGRFDEAIEELERAREHDPDSPAIRASLGLVHGVAGRPVEAGTELKGTLEADADFALAYYFLGQTYLRMERLEDALAALGNASRLAPGSVEFRASLGHAYALAGKADRARQLLEELETLREERYVSAALFAEVQAGLGETEKALSWLEEAEKEHSPELSWIGVRPAFRTLRASAAFTALLERIGLPT